MNWSQEQSNPSAMRYPQNTLTFHINLLKMKTLLASFTLNKKRQLPVHCTQWLFYYNDRTTQSIVLTEVVQAPLGGWLTIKGNTFFTLVCWMGMLSRRSKFFAEQGASILQPTMCCNILCMWLKLIYPVVRGTHISLSFFENETSLGINLGFTNQTSAHEIIFNSDKVIILWFHVLV